MDRELSLQEKKKTRFETIVDIVYLLGLTSLYIGSLVMPVVGILIGIILKTGSLTERAKKVGNICLILALIGFGIWVVGIVAGAVIFSSYGWFW